MAEKDQREVWLRGPLPEIIPPLQPVAHALLQAREELVDVMKDFPDNLLWHRPGSVASPGFHLKHMAGVLDRLFTYAAGEGLSEKQLTALAAEGLESEVSTTELVKTFCLQIDTTLAAIKQTAATDLFEQRGVGRAQLPSTVFGLMVHAAEHSMRHLGQLLVTVKIIKAGVAQVTPVSQPVYDC